MVSILGACKKDEHRPQSFSPDIFYKRMSTLRLDVAYEPGAEPYMYTVTGHAAWEFSEYNIESVFAPRPQGMDVWVPASLTDMLAIPPQGKTSFTANDIKRLADSYRLEEGTDTDGNIFIFFLNGYFFQNDSVNYNVLGVHLSGTTVIALFKPAINKASLTLAMRQFTEQSVVIHEVGHALGLVNKGVPMTAAHEDTVHPAHCTNADCVMYWQNEFSLSIAGQVQHFRDGVKFIVFGPECVEDISSYFP